MNYQMDITIAYLKTLDSLNEVFRDKMEDLSRQQKQIVTFLAEKQGAVNVKEISKRLFISHQTASGQLKKLLEKRIVERHSFGRESYYDIADIHFRHWLDIKAGRGERIVNYVEFVQQYHSNSGGIVQCITAKRKQTNGKILHQLRSLEPNNIQTEKEQSLDKLLKYWFLAQDIFREQK